MASRFRVLETLDRSPVAPQATGAWRDDLGMSNLVPFSLEAIEPPRPGTGKLAYPSLDASTPARQTSSLTHAGGPRQTAPLGQTGGLAHVHATGHTGYLTGISLSGILQMMHMERNSCVLEVSSGGRLGTLTLVNGELIDAAIDGAINPAMGADCGDECGDAVAMRILRWPSPVTAILPAAPLVRHSVTLPLTRLLMDAVRMEDEAIVLPDAARRGEPVGVDAEVAAPRRWRELPARLVELGALAALVMTAGRDEPVAEAGTGDDRAASNAMVARGLRTWATLLVDGVDRVHVIAGTKRLVVATLGRDTGGYVYLEAPADMPLGEIWREIGEAS